MTTSVLALEWTSVNIGVAIVIILMGLWLIPYLIKENRDGKKELGPVREPAPGGRVRLGPETPPGIGDNRPGTRDNPAPGQADGQADPYSARAQRPG